MAEPKLKKKLRVARKQMYQRIRKPHAKHGNETMKATRSPYDMNGLKEFPGD